MFAPSFRVPAFGGADRLRRTRRPAWLLALGVVLTFAFGLATGQLVFSGMSEGYCWVWPSIGTRFASDYSERGYNHIQTGMTQDEVLRLIGSPLGRAFNGRPAPSGWSEWQPGDLTWQYSSDSSALGGDWAWLSREVVFRDGRVVNTVRWVYYD